MYVKFNDFWSFFLFVDTPIIPVFVVPELFWNTAKGVRGISIFQKLFQLINFTKLKNFSKVVDNLWFSRASV